MSTTTYNAGVAARKATNAAAKKAALRTKNAVGCVTDFVKGFFTAAEKPTRARKPAARKPATAKK
jgi:hypothetical protein